MKKIIVLVILLLMVSVLPTQAALSNEIMKIVSKYGDDAVKLFSKYGDDVFKVVSKYGDDVIVMVTKYGDDAVKIVTKYGDDGVKILSKYGDDGVKILSNFGDDGVKIISKYSDDAIKVFRGFGDDAIKAIKNFDEVGLKIFLKNGTLGIEVIKRNASKSTVQVLAELTEKSLDKICSVIKQAPDVADDMFKLVEKYGQPVVDFVFENGEKALKIIGRNKASVAFAAVVAYAFTHSEQVEKGMELTEDTIKEVIKGPITTFASGSVTVVKDTTQVVATNLTDSWLIKLAVAIAILLVIGVLCWIGFDYYKKRMKAKKQANNASQSDIDDSPRKPSWDK